MTTALIFAGGTRKRMNSRSMPKQFLEMHGKPIIIYTLECFEYHDAIDNIVAVCTPQLTAGSFIPGKTKSYNIHIIIHIISETV